MMEDTRGLECLWGNIKEHPQCPHGPTLLFGKYINGELEKFYACSACRDRKLCRFYLKHGESLTKQQKHAWELRRKELFSRYPHRKLFIHFNKLMAENPIKRSYCHECERLIFTSEKGDHKDHQVIEGLSDHQMTHPTEILKPLNNAKKEAQYLFAKRSIEVIVDILLKLQAKQVICIGAPRIHEHISQHCEDKMSSLLLDIDGRFHNFFGPLNYCWYNLFNHHFFHQDSVDVFKDFLTQNNGKDTYVICDPPFGGRVEAISQTIKRISDLHKKWNDIEHDNDPLKIMLIFPYFMEPIMREKSNPPGISGGLKDLRMSDYKVDYDNHPLFVTEENGKKQGSPVRIFTNVPLSLIELPESDGYKYCKRCDKWVSIENKHCKKCKECTSKDGRTYKHCKSCDRCVKPTWKHCSSCQRCHLEKHDCSKVPKVAGKCFKCNEFGKNPGHTEKNCNVNAKTEEVKPKKAKKHKIEDKAEKPTVKRKKPEDLSKSKLKIRKTSNRQNRTKKTS